MQKIELSNNKNKLIKKTDKNSSKQQIKISKKMKNLSCNV